VGVSLSAGQIPAEGIVENSVIRLSHVDDAGQAEVLVPYAYVLRVVNRNDDSTQLSVLIRSDLGVGDVLEEVSGSNAEGSLAAAALYDMDPLEVLDRCRGEEGG
jgi:hypothetical protein